MKQLYYLFGGFWLALLGLCPLAGRAQSVGTGPLDSLRHDLDYFFAPLNKSQVPTPYLENMGVPFLPLRPFNGTLSDTCVLTLPQWRQLYATVFSSQVKALPTAELLPLLGDLNADLAQQLAAAPAGAIPLLVERLDYAALRPDARAANLLSYSGGQLHDVPGRTQSPYQLPR